MTETCEWTEVQIPKKVINRTSKTIRYLRKVCEDVESAEKKKKKKDEQHIPGVRLQNAGNRGTGKDRKAVRNSVDDKETEGEIFSICICISMKREMKDKAKVAERRDDSKGTQKKTAVSTTAAAATKTRRCFNCGDKNHVSADSPVKDKDVNCFKCNEHRHKATVCPTKAKESNLVSRTGDKKYMKDVVIWGQKLTALLDTGSDLTFMRTDEYVKIGSPVLLNRKVKFDGEEYPITFHEENVTLAKVEVNDNTDVPEIYKINVVDTNTINKQPEKTCSVGIHTKIIVKDDISVAARLRRLSPAERDEVEIVIQDWLDNGIIRPSTSEYASPIVLVKKKNERLQFPLPLIEDQIDSLQGAMIFTTIDLENVFSMCQSKNRTPFGLSVSQAYFKKFINAVFKDLIQRKIVLTYIDDWKHFETFKTRLTNGSVLRLYRVGADTELHADASRRGYGDNYGLSSVYNDLCLRVARWALPGNNMKHVDALSRNSLPSVLLITDIDNGLIVNLGKAQSEEGKIRTLVEDKERCKLCGYVVQRGLLYKVIKDDVLLVCVVPRLVMALNTHYRVSLVLQQREYLPRVLYNVMCANRSIFRSLIPQKATGRYRLRFPPQTGRFTCNWGYKEEIFNAKYISEVMIANRLNTAYKLSIKAQHTSPRLTYCFISLETSPCAFKSRYWFFHPVLDQSEFEPPID
ncbi:unnamed protein product [Brassicogethes aeneus]|uniref:CCHC-type domain-containing protein n=1 Tax=Brassicogethes aeneus TaxID=1431903 RepID=A0A9P0B0V9_BRAAE|nr:unnamed protein product [Brassicogethes aeneus]